MSGRGLVLVGVRQAAARERGGAQYGSCGGGQLGSFHAPVGWRTA